MKTRPFGIWRDIPVTAASLRESDKDLSDFLSQLSGKEAEEILHTWEFWARPNQLEPEGNWSVCLVNAGRGFGKDLAKTEPILTTQGWKTMGDIQVGDYVYAWDGTPTKVTGLYEPAPRQLVKFTFSDNTTIVSSVEHDWVTWTHRDRKSFGRNEGGALPDNWPNWSLRGAGPSMKTSQEIIQTFTYGKRQDRNHSIPLAMPLEGIYDESIIDPYYLGVWLGDGLSNACHEVTIGDEDKEFYQSLWPEFNYRGNLIYRAPTDEFQWLRDLGLRLNKHIPDQVFCASKTQRLEVLRGLMDSDGYASKSSVEFTTTNKNLAEGTLRLVRSLGQKPVMCEGRATL